MLPNGSKTPGGPSLYSAWVASSLQVDVTLYSRVTPTYDAAAFEGFCVVPLPASSCPQFSNRYDADGKRTQHLYEIGEAIACADVPVLEGDALLVAPAFHELSGVPDNATATTVVMLQAALRETDNDNLVHPTDRPEEAAAAFLVPDGTFIFSEEDVKQPFELAEAQIRQGATVLVTLGRSGVRLFRPGLRAETIPGYPAISRDPTGAGDAFAAAFTIRLSETGDLIEACRFANAAGSLAVEGSGREAIPTRPRVEERMVQGAA